MRAKFLVTSALLVGLTILCLTQAGSAQQRRGGGGRGPEATSGGGAPGGGGGFRMDPNQVFDFMAKGKPTVEYADSF